MSELEDLFDNRKKPSLKYNKRKTKRTIIKPFGEISLNARKGKVVSITGTNIIVKDENAVESECNTAGIIISENEKESIICVGDNVMFLPNDKNISSSGTILKVEKRKNHFSRKEVGYLKEDVIASNIDKLIIMVAAVSPVFNPRLLDRYLVSAELNSVEPMICVNKMDLVNENDIIKEFEVYENLGYNVYFISAKFNKGLSTVYQLINNYSTVISGPSGTGKSTFLNTILGSAYQSVNETSLSTSKGKHTTSAVRMFSLPDGGEIIDTPGLREFGVWGLKKNELALYFHEFDKFNNICKYYPCTHTHEPDCAVIEAVEKGQINFGRYESYINLFDSLD